MRVLLCAMAVAGCLGARAQPAEMATNGSFETLGDAGLRASAYEQIEILQARPRMADR